MKITLPIQQTSARNFSSDKYPYRTFTKRLWTNGIPDFSGCDFPKTLSPKTN